VFLDDLFSVNELFLKSPAGILITGGAIFQPLLEHTRSDPAIGGQEDRIIAIIGQTAIAITGLERKRIPIIFKESIPESPSVRVTLGVLPMGQAKATLVAAAPNNVPFVNRHESPSSCPCP
jgi:hypothetical protein